MLLDSGRVVLALSLTTLPANPVVLPVRILGTLLPAAQLCQMPVQACLL